MALLAGLATGGRILFAAPGAVVILTAFLTPRQNGLIALAGPLTNLVLAVAFLPFAYLPGWVGSVGLWGARVNSFLAFFNLLPFPPLDGSKVFLWKPAAWVAVEIPVFGLMVFLG
jgi:Zn-dependent protease